MSKFIVAKFITGLNTAIAGADTLMEYLAQGIKEAGPEGRKALQKDLYAQARAVDDGERCYAAARKMWSRAMESLGLSATKAKPAKKENKHAELIAWMRKTARAIDKDDGIPLLIAALYDVMGEDVGE